MPKNLEIALILDNTRFNRALAASGAKVKTVGKKMAAGIQPAIAGFNKLAKGVGAVGLAAGAAAAATGIYALNSVLRESIALANEQEAAEAKLEAVVSATGESAGLTADEMKSYAAELQAVTTYGDEVTISSMAILASFKQIKGDEFKRATAAAQDMATVMGTDLNSSVLQVGKALNDPIKGISALSRAGVQFTESQKEQIKVLQESGDLMGAQAIILKELEGQFGGAAKAARGTFGGAVTAAGNALGDLKEEIGFAITKNEFFLKGIELLEQKFISWTAQLNANGDAAREWARTVGLGVLSATQAALTGIDLLYRGFNLLTGSFKGTAAAALFLAGGIFKIVEAGAALTDALGITNGATEEWGLSAEAAFGAAEELAAKSKKDFEEMANGSAKIETAKKALEEFQTTMENIGTEKVDDISKPIDGAAKSTGKYEEQLVKVNGVWVQQKKLVSEADDEVDKIVRKLEALQGKQINVTINERTVQQRAMGGFIHMLAAGGKLAGYGGGDRIPALLEAGEFVIRKEAVSRFGAGLFSSLNSFSLPALPAFATGGPVGVMAGSGAGETINVNLSLPGSDSPVSVQTDRYNADKLLRDVARMKRLRSS